VGHNYPGKGNVGLKTIENFVLDFPENKIILGHWGGGLPFYELMPEIKLAFKNVYYDSAASPFLYNPNVFSIMARLVGTKKMLFGSDYPVINQDRVLIQLENSSLPESQKLAIQHTNMKKLISVPI
jgi:predicted TIM-barrel fold metal-dependent hydrolase